MRHNFQKSENLPKEWKTEICENVFTWSTHFVKPHLAWYLSPMIIMPCVSSKHQSPLGLLRLGWPWLKGKGRKETKACTETMIEEDKLELQSNLAGPAKWASALSVTVRTTAVCSDRNQPTAASELQAYIAVAQPHPTASILPCKLMKQWENNCWQTSLLDSFENNNNDNINTSICWDSRTCQALEWALEKHYL